MVWLETPTNPLLKLADIKAVADNLKFHRPDIILVVDNTFLTCYFQVSFQSLMRIIQEKLTIYICIYKIRNWNKRILFPKQKPLELGADIVMYSLTKYMNGHSDVIMGAAITHRDDLAEQLRFLQNGFNTLKT
jgi:cystathionine gamma-lyase